MIYKTYRGIRTFTEENDKARGEIKVIVDTGVEGTEGAFLFPIHPATEIDKREVYFEWGDGYKGKLAYNLSESILTDFFGKEVMAEFDYDVWSNICKMFMRDVISNLPYSDFVIEEEQLDAYFKRLAEEEQRNGNVHEKLMEEPV